MSSSRLTITSKSYPLSCSRSETEVDAGIRSGKYQFAESNWSQKASGFKAILYLFSKPYLMRRKQHSYEDPAVFSLKSRKRTRWFLVALDRSIEGIQMIVYARTFRQREQSFANERSGGYKHFDRDIANPALEAWMNYKRKPEQASVRVYMFLHSILTAPGQSRFRYCSSCSSAYPRRIWKRSLGVPMMDAICTYTCQH